MCLPPAWKLHMFSLASSNWEYSIASENRVGKRITCASLENISVEMRKQQKGGDSAITLSLLSSLYWIEKWERQEREKRCCPTMGVFCYGEEAFWMKKKSRMNGCKRKRLDTEMGSETERKSMTQCWQTGVSNGLLTYLRKQEVTSCLIGTAEPSPDSLFNFLSPGTGIETLQKSTLVYYQCVLQSINLHHTEMDLTISKLNMKHWAVRF